MKRDALLDNILANPTDLDLRSVWADALIERGDPRGELITLQIRGEAGPLTPAQDKRMRSLLSKHRGEWLGELAGIVQSREGLVFERGVLGACQIQVKHLAGLQEAIGSPLWSTVRSVHFCDRFAWDPRIVPLLANPVMRSLREVIYIGANQVFAPLARHPRPLPFTSIWTGDDEGRGEPVVTIDKIDNLASLPNLTRLGFTTHDDGMQLLSLPVVRLIKTLGLTTYATAGEWMRRTRPLDNLTTLELRRWWIPIQGPTRSHFILRFTRGKGGQWSKLDVGIAGRPKLSMLADDIESIKRVTKLESLTSTEPEVSKAFR